MSAEIYINSYILNVEDIPGIKFKERLLNMYLSELNHLRKMSILDPVKYNYTCEEDLAINSINNVHSIFEKMFKF